MNLEDKDLLNDGAEVARYIRNLATTCRSPHTDGFTQCHCKRQLFVLKCFIDDEYKDLPEFPEQERKWEQERTMDILKNE